MKKEEIRNFVYSGIEVKNAMLPKQLNTLVDNIYRKHNNLEAYTKEVDSFLNKYICDFRREVIDEFIDDFNNLEKPYLISTVTFNQIELFRYMNEGQEYYEENNELVYLYSNPNSKLGRVNREGRRMLYTSVCPDIAIKEANISSNIYSRIEYKIIDDVKLLYLGFKSNINNNGIIGLFNKFWSILLSNNNDDDFYYVSNKIIDIFEHKIRSEKLDGIIWKSHHYKNCNDEECTKENIALFDKSERKIKPKLIAMDTDEYDIIINEKNYKLEKRNINNN